MRQVPQKPESMYVTKKHHIHCYRFVRLGICKVQVSNVVTRSCRYERVDQILKNPLGF